MEAGLHAEAHSAASGVRHDTAESGAPPEPPAVPCWQVHRWGRASQVKLALALVVVTAIALFWTLGGTQDWIEDFGRCAPVRPCAARAHVRPFVYARRVATHSLARNPHD